MAMRPLFGSTWTEDQVKRFQEAKSDDAIIALTYDIAEAELAFRTFQILSQMIPDESPHRRPALIPIYKTAIEIVCRRLLGERYSSGPPLLKKRETCVPEPMEEDRSALIDKVRYWFEHEGKATKNDVDLDHLEAALAHSKLRTRKEGRHVERIKAEDWAFPASFIANRLQAAAKNLLVIDAEGDAMAPTIMSGDKVIVDTGHKTPSPDGLYAIRDAFDNVIVRRLQLLRAAHPSRVKIISDNSKHAAEEVALSELEIVGKGLCCLKLL